MTPKRGKNHEKTQKTLKNSQTKREKSGKKGVFPWRRMMVKSRKVKEN